MRLLRFYRTENCELFHYFIDKTFKFKFKAETLQMVNFTEK